VRVDGVGAAPGAGSFVCSFRFALSVLCFVVTMNLYAQRVGMSVAIVCMVNHTAVLMMRDAANDRSSSSSSSSNVTMMMTPGEWSKNQSNYDATKQSSLQSPCLGNLVADNNSSGSVVS